MKIIEFPTDNKTPRPEAEINTVRLWEIIVETQREMQILREQMRRDRKRMVKMATALEKAGIIPQSSSSTPRQSDRQC